MTAHDDPVSATDEFQVRLHWPAGAENGRAEPAARPAAPPSRPDEPSTPTASGAETASGLAPSLALLTTVNSLLESLHDTVASVNARLDALADRSAAAERAVSTELANLREEVVQLRRRLAVRGREPVKALDDEQVEQLAARVIAHLDTRAASRRK